MTPTELAQLQTMIDASVDRGIERIVQKIIQPLRTDLDTLKTEAKTLEADTRKHSGAHRDLAKNTDRISQNDLKQEAAIAQTLTKVSAIDARLTTVEANQTTAAKERGATAGMTKEIYDDSKKFFAKHPAVANAIVGLVVAGINVITVYLTILAMQGKH